ncbi:patatin-like phospholipase family protein [Parvicella tangerina]|uniref:NTE family protein n=1 Tax=Parvicella tangerina TaxID=2829795 RepID=A0A916NQZ9_9FLAO|nr:patatin-like phospholipase family protein [Parvicella tangerina]CAG5080204.1 putative NTE family protein [Parvicella tangerina]
MAQERQKIGLALGGGAVLGAAHVGVLKALEEFEVKVDYIAGTSIGAFVGAFYAFGMHWQKIKEIAIEMNWMDITSIRLSKYGLMSNDKMETILAEHLGDKRIEDAQIPIWMIATDLETGNKVVLKEGALANAVKASTCIPGVFSPIEHDSKLLVDGGIVENVPIETLGEMGANYKIGVDLNSKHRQEKPSHLLDILTYSFQYLMQNSTLHQTSNANILIKPDLTAFSKTSMDQMEGLFNQGYEDAARTLEKEL